MIFILYTFLPQWDFFPWGNSGRFPQGKPAATESRYPTLIRNKVHHRFFRVSIIHRTLTSTIGSLTCVSDHSYACVYTLGGWAHRQRVSTTFLTPDGVRTSGLWISSLTLYPMSHPVTLCFSRWRQISRRCVPTKQCAPRRQW